MSFMWIGIDTIDISTTKAKAMNVMNSNTFEDVIPARVWPVCQGKE